MRLPRLRLAVLATTAVCLLAACGSATPASPASTASLAPQPSPQADTYWLRATSSQAIPPIDQFPLPPDEGRQGVPAAGRDAQRRRPSDRGRWRVGRP